MVRSKIEDRINEFEYLFNRGLSDYKIGKLMGFNHATIFQFRKKHGYIRDSLKENKEVNPTQEELEILVGTLLGDSTLRVTGNSNPSFSCAHGIKQKEYAEYKTALLVRLGATCTYHKRNIPDKRNGVYYEDYTIRLKANPAFKELYNMLYVNGTKILSEDILDYFSERSLAFMFMDDGGKIGRGYTIATNCFNEEDIKRFRLFLFEKFNLETSMFKSKVLYVHAKSKNQFKQLIMPYICESMKYKL